jgi:hypothetical protein
MRQIAWWFVPVAVLAGNFCVAATLLHHIEAHRLGVPGGYLPIALGSVGVGLCAGAGSFITSVPEWRSIPLAVAIASGVSLMTAGLLLVILVRAFGT